MHLQRSATVTAVGLAAIALTLAACGQKGGAGGGMGMGGPTEVGYIVAQSQPVGLTTELAGRTSAHLVSEVRPQVGGVIKARLFQEGSIVRAGQSLYQIDPATYQATYNSAAAALAQAQAQATAAKLKADRYKALVATGAVSKQDNDDAQAAALQTAAAVAVQKAALDTARINLNYTRVAAPISGRIGKSSVTPGALVTASQATALATVQDLSKIYVDLTQTSAELLKLQAAFNSGKLGRSGSAQVTLKLEDGSTYPIPGRLEFSDVTVDPTTGSVVLRAIFDNPNGVLLPGMYVRAVLDKGVANNGILIPQAAVSRDPKGAAIVQVVDAKGGLAPRPVTAAQTVGDKWLITTGLNVGDKVVVEGLQKVRPGAPVKPVAITAQAQR
ncbi:MULTISPECIES: efflux RND transporter periplasmic adaptor subunit [unclassified Caulobacter]|jgi:membrane fusion protein (multidrug efflux system)|uniref:efflux RND transporter periplasmic adaptor subunit n=1 Tax=unclassified Caulobacter TaxID=2648921 RepID=UPI0006FBD740|nr:MULTISPECIES: efflux RND transporter periplasmic adaptor subunit [unclassified Caulobacter]KQV55856.1 hemolysin D [Caulobacter sp. Root342]KQV70970.1 hemolysin D [Caulobacter sp. Root343]